MFATLPDPMQTAFAVALSSASFKLPRWRPRPVSTWSGHAPFAFWLVQALQPRSFVELGTQHGYSFFAICQAVSELGLKTPCTAIDTWKGDEHIGSYGEEVFQQVQRVADQYRSFVRLQRSTFDEARDQFADGSIDLLHIDGLHLYDAVRHDWTTWEPKMSEHGIVLFHDTRVFDKGFGVHQLWREIRSRSPSFEFFHSYGLGVLGVGAHLPEPLHRFFEAVKDEAVASEVRQVYARLGASIPG
jgi:hypothetical protein